MKDRRSFLAGMLAAGVAPVTTWADVDSPAFLSAGLTRQGDFLRCGLGRNWRITFSLPLPARGHAAATHPLRAEAVAVARRAGTYAIVLDCVTGQARAQLSAPVGDHF